MHRLQWPNLDGTQVMADVDDLKDRKVHGELYRTEKETQQDGIQDPQEIRNKYILNGNAAGFTYEDLGNIFDISSGRVGQIVREQEKKIIPIKYIYQDRISGSWQIYIPHFGLLLSGRFIESR
jgi:hypothetical protein